MCETDCKLKKDGWCKHTQTLAYMERQRNWKRAAILAVMRGQDVPEKPDDSGVPEGVGSWGDNLGGNFVLLKNGECTYSG